MALSVRRATVTFVHILPTFCISIHALRKESDSHEHPTVDKHSISIHALRKESDIAAAGDYMLRYDFNPRSP